MVFIYPTFYSVIIRIAICRIIL